MERQVATTDRKTDMNGQIDKGRYGERDSKQLSK